MHTKIWLLGIALTLACSAVMALGLPHSIAALALASPATNPIVLGPIVLDNPPLLLVELLLAAGLVCLPASTILRRRGRRAQRDRNGNDPAREHHPQDHDAADEGSAEAKAEPHRSLPQAIAVTAISILAFFIGSVLLLAALVAGISTPYVLPETSPSGGRLIVVDRAFLLVGKGDVYYAAPGSITTEHIGSYLTDDGYNPIAYGTYSLTWTDEEPDFSIWGGGGVWYYPDRDEPATGDGAA